MILAFDKRNILGQFYLLSSFKYSICYKVHILDIATYLQYNIATKMYCKVGDIKWQILLNY